MSQFLQRYIHVHGCLRSSHHRSTLPVLGVQTVATDWAVHQALRLLFTLTVVLSESLCYILCSLVCLSHASLISFCGLNQSWGCSHDCWLREGHTVSEAQQERDLPSENALYDMLDLPSANEPHWAMEIGCWNTKGERGWQMHMYQRVWSATPELPSTGIYVRTPPMLVVRLKWLP